MSVSFTREQRRSLRRIEERLVDLEAGISRHEGRAAELKGIIERLRGERELLLAKATASPPAAELTEVAPEPEAQVERTERKGGPPPEAACVACAGEDVAQPAGVQTGASITPAEVVDRFRQYQEGQRTRRRTPQVVYPMSSSPGELGLGVEGS